MDEIQHRHARTRGHERKQAYMELGRTHERGGGVRGGRKEGREKENECGCVTSEQWGVARATTRNSDTSNKALMSLRIRSHKIKKKKKRTLIGTNSIFSCRPMKRYGLEHDHTC